MLISQTVKCLIYELEHEFVDIRRIMDLQTDYAIQAASLEKWLHEKPDVSELQASMQRIKLLKSKLRHLLADYTDAQEVCGLIIITSSHSIE